MRTASARGSSRTAATREKLFAATSVLLGERGVDQVSVDEIALRAGVAKGTVYYNFESKERLVEELLADRGATLGEELREIGNAGRPVISTITETLLGFVERNLALAQLIVAELWRESSRWHVVLKDLRTDVLDIIESLIADLDRQTGPDGGRAGAIPARAVAAGLLATGLTVALDWQVYTPSRARDEVREQISLLFQLRR